MVFQLCEPPGDVAWLSIKLISQCRISSDQLVVEICKYQPPRSWLTKGAPTQSSENKQTRAGTTCGIHSNEM